ncbi:MAG TPA: TadE/TadG family type IV pilus assembly protein [Rhodoblastus sp.]|nr:TadE/TadG family type IV pilus assembly protein [Rhodoblastus sp.]
MSARRGLWSDQRAAAIVEFGLMTPIFLAVLGASIDVGMAVKTKFQLASALATASNYALNNASSASSTNGASFASSLATLASSANSANWANSVVVVNNGPTASISNGTLTPSGTASNADNYYCPTGSNASIVWGSSVSQGSSCGASGAVAGKFVQITVSRAYTSLILPSPLVASSISATSVVQVQ